MLSMTKSRYSFLKLAATSLGITLLVAVIVVGSESIDVADAASSSDQVVITLSVTPGISITAPANSTMSTNLGISTNMAVGTTTWNVKTNNALGYSMTVQALTNPAMKSGSNIIADYSTTSMPSLWSVSGGDARFGFSAFGTDVNTATWGTPTGNFCNGAATSTVNAGLKYYGFYTNATTTSTRAATTTTSGVDTTVCYAVQQNNYYISSGDYTASITATATTL